MRIAIIGGAGNMGRWLVDYFLNFDHSIVVADRNNSMEQENKESRIEFAESNICAVKNADVVFVSVPIDCTSDVIREVAPQMKKDSILCEISTMKTKVHAAMMELQCNDVRLLSIHPLFGPAVGLLNKRFALIPVGELKQEREIFGSLFPNSEVIIIDVKNHDRIMALTLSVPYFFNMVLASVFKNEDIVLMQQLSGTTFAIQFMITGSMMSHSSSFQTALLKENVYTLEFLEILRSEIDKALKLLIHDVDSFQKSIRNIQLELEKKICLTGQYNEMYKTLEVMQHLKEQGVEL